MFGYVKTHKGELRVWEYETYKGIYCSLCRQLGKTYGPLARLTLNYDFTFLAVLSLSLKDGVCEFQNKPCTFNPLKQCKYAKNCSDDLEFAAGAAMVMLYYKLMDNVEDSKGFKKIGYKLLIPLFKSKHKKAKKLYPHFYSVVEEYISAQSELEKRNCTDLDKITEPTSDALGKIFALCSEEEAEKRVLYRLGYSMGKWIYLIDCAADIEKDVRSGNYNPLKGEIPTGTDPKTYAEERLKPLLYNCIGDCGLSFELLDIKKYKGILENIIYLGLKLQTNQVFTKETK